MPKYVPKSVQTCFQHALRYFSGEKIRPVHPGGSRNRKILKMEKNSIFQNPEKRFQKCPNFFEVFFSELFLTNAAWRSKLVEIRKKIEKKWIPKSVQKRS